MGMYKCFTCHRRIYGTRIHFIGRSAVPTCDKCYRKRSDSLYSDGREYGWTMIAVIAGLIVAGALLL